MLVLVGAGVVGQQEAEVLVGRHPRGGGIDPAVETLDLLDVDIEVDARGIVEPPLLEATVVGGAGPGPDGRGQTVLEVLGPGDGAPHGAAVESHGAAQRDRGGRSSTTTPSDSRRGRRAASARSSTSNQSRSPWRVHSSGSRGADAHRVPARFAVGVAVDEGHQELDDAGSAPAPKSKTSGQARICTPSAEGSSPVVPAAVGSSSMMALEDAGCIGQPRPKSAAARPFAPAPAGHSSEPTRRPSSPRRAPQGRHLWHHVETVDPFAESAARRPVRVRDHAGIGRHPTGGEDRVVDRGQGRIVHPQPPDGEPLPHHGREPIGLARDAIDDPLPREIAADAVVGDEDHPFGLNALARRPALTRGSKTEQTSRGQREQNGSGRESAWGDGIARSLDSRTAMALLRTRLKHGEHGEPRRIHGVSSHSSQEVDRASRRTTVGPGRMEPGSINVMPRGVPVVLRDLRVSSAGRSSSMARFGNG